MTKWARGIPAITLFVEDLDAAKRFYDRVFEIPPKFEDDDSVVIDFGNMLINLLRTAAVPELIEPAKLAAAGSGSRVQLTVAVDDVDVVVAKLRKLKVALLNGPMDRPWGIRTASFQDPAGHIWEIAAG